MEVKNIKTAGFELIEQDFFDSQDYKKEYINLENIKDTGYYFDENGILRYLKDNSPFPFKSLLVPLFKVRYDIFRTLTAKYVREILSEIGIISEIISTPKMPNGLRILHSKNFMTHTGPLLVVIQAGGVTRAGVWSPRLLMHTSGGINVASQLSQLKRALDSNYAVLVVNPNERIASPRSSGGSIETSPEEIIHSVWRSLVPRCRTNKIVIWAHMYGGTAFLYPLQPPPVLKNLKKSSIITPGNGSVGNSGSNSATYFKAASSPYMGPRNPLKQPPSGYCSIDSNDGMVANGNSANIGYNCSSMDFASSKLLISSPSSSTAMRSDTFDIESPKLSNFVSRQQRDQPPFPYHSNHEFKLPPSYQKCSSSATRYPMVTGTRQQNISDIYLENLPPSLSTSSTATVPPISNLHQMMEADGALDLLFPPDPRPIVPNCALTSPVSPLTTVSIASVATETRRAPGSLRKRTSVSSNNATDNSSLHSDNSISGFSAASPKMARSLPPKTKTSTAIPQSPYDALQRSVDERWTARRATFWRSIEERVAGILFTDSALCLRMQGVTDPRVLAWFRTHAVHYVACVEERGADLNRASFAINEVPTRSAGTAEHDIIPHLVTEEAFAFFQAQLAGPLPKEAGPSLPA